MTRPYLKLPQIKYPGTARAMIAVMSSQIGYREGPNNDTIFGRWYGMNKAPWCAILVSWAAFFSGCKKIIPKHAYTPAGARWFKKKGQWGNVPKVGAIVYYDTAGLGRISHTGVVDKVYSVSPLDFTAIEGNTNAQGSREGRVVRRQRRKTVGPRGGFGYPNYAKVPKAVVTPKVPILKTVDEIAREVIAGKWGHGEDRIKRLTAAGYSARAVQIKVNMLLK